MHQEGHGFVVTVHRRVELARASPFQHVEGLVERLRNRAAFERRRQRQWPDGRQLSDGRPAADERQTRDSYEENAAALHAVIRHRE